MLEPASPVLFGRTPSRLRRRAVRLLAERVRTEVAGGRAFTCLLTGDREVKNLNRRFRGRNEPTDVLSFPAPCLPEGLASILPAQLLGELAISCERARVQAREHGHSLEEEIGILILHGVLHLMGMDHETDRGRMRRAETRWRRKLELPEGLVERAARGEARR
ncbi:MAG: rRNA maturation RNase YbeY [Bryobacterales bacterium]|nr:rRNA maturation RNase YbeY [Bryobacterales bacterium]